MIGQVGGHGRRSRFPSWKTPASIALLDHLQIQPVCARFLACGWTPTTTVLRHFPIHFDHRLIDPTPAIRKRRGWSIEMSTALEHLEHADTGLRFILFDGTCNAQRILASEGVWVELASAAGLAGLKAEIEAGDFDPKGKRSPLSAPGTG